MAVEVTAGQIDKEEVVVTINIRMPLKDWRKFFQELSAANPMSLLVRGGLKAVFDKIS
jgi:hypothetical protein